MSTRAWVYSMMDELAEEEFDALATMVEVLYKNSQNKKPKRSISSVKGILHEYADPSKIPLEETAWAEAAAEKHLKFLEEMKDENN